MFGELILLVLLWFAGSIVFSWFMGFWTRTMTANHFDDPVYKDNLEKLIKHHRQFEKKQ